MNAYNIAKAAGVNYVYIGNSSVAETAATYCKNCGKPVIKRVGYGLGEYNLDNDSCMFCGEKCAGMFE